jgi:PAS domain-containing protein
VRVEIPDRPLPNRRCLLSSHLRRRRVRCALEEVNRGLQLGSMPRHLPATGDLIDPQADPRKCVIDRQSAFTRNFRKGLRVGRVRAALIRCDGAGCCVERNQRAGFGFHQRQPAGQRISGPGEGIRAGEIQDDHHRLQMQRGERPHVVGESESFDGNARVTRNSRIDGNEIVLALQLHPVSRKIDVSDRVRTRRR